MVTIMELAGYGMKYGQDSFIKESRNSTNH